MLAPQFFQGSLGPLFANYYTPDPSVSRQGDILYIHPFAEEMNKSRRMAALQARCFAAAGFGVFMPDLYGCGDSAGDFAEARWEIWMADLKRCLAWLQNHHNGPPYLWGLRLGGLLAAELAREPDSDVGRMILWQPVISGEQMLTQFLRLRLAAGMAKGNKETTRQLREVLAAGCSLEVAGYELSPALAAALDRARLRTPATGMKIDWFELVAEPGRPLMPASQRLVDGWQAAGVKMHVRTVPGEPFWSIQEITTVPALLEATTACLCEVTS